MRFDQVLAVFAGNDGEATKAMYDALASLGPAGQVALNVFRASKTSGAAKRYRGRFTGAAYDRKQFSIDNLCQLLSQHGPALGISWGWGRDPAQPRHQDVLYIDLPGAGQVSFHTGSRGAGPNYDKPWDGVRDIGPTRACRYCAEVFLSATAQQGDDHAKDQ